MSPITTKGKQGGSAVSAKEEVRPAAALSSTGERLLFQVETTLLPDTAPKILGGPKPALVGRLASINEEEQAAKEETLFPCLQNSHYVKAEPRLAPAQLPGLRSRDKVFLDKEAEKAFKEIYRGNFTIRTSIKTLRVVGDDDKNKKTMYRFHVAAVLLPKDVPAVDEQYCLLPILSISFLTDNIDQCTDLEFGYGNDFNCALGPSQQVAIQYRLWHFFLRHQGGALLSDSVFHHLAAALREEYTASSSSQQWWKEALDVAMIEADVSLRQERHWRWQERFLLKYGHMLEANKHHKRAALIFQDMAYFARFKDSKEDQLEHLSLCHFQTSCSLTSAGEFERAEEQLIMALYLELVQNAPGEQLPWSSVGARLSLRSMLVEQLVRLYNAWLAVVAEGDEKFRVACTLVALLVLAKASHKDRPSFYQEWIETSVKAKWCPAAGAKAAVKAAFQTPEAAQQVLMEAISSPCTSANFHATILGCSTLHDISVKITDDCFLPSNAEQSAKNYDKKMKKEARRASTPNGPKETHIRCLCAYEGCSAKGIHHTTNSLKYCPCQVVGYCGKQCQNADWKRHKKECPWQAQKKKTG